MGIKERLGLTGPFKFAVIGSLIGLILGIIVLILNQILWITAGFSNEEMYTFQMIMISIVGLVLPGSLMVLSILGSLWHEKSPRIHLTFGIIIASLAPFILVITVLLIFFVIEEVSMTYADFLYSFIICILIADAMLVLCTYIGIKNIIAANKK